MHQFCISRKNFLHFASNEALSFVTPTNFSVYDAQYLKVGNPKNPLAKTCLQET